MTMTSRKKRTSSMMKKMMMTTSKLCSYVLISTRRIRITRSCKLLSRKVNSCSKMKSIN